MKKFLALLLASVMTMSLLTACGNKTAEAEVAAATTEEGAADTEAAVSEALADGVLTVGTNAEFPPFEYVDDNGEPDGFDMALIP